MGDPFGRAVGPVGSAEGIIDKDIRQAGQGFGKIGLVGFFFGMKTQVFKEDNLFFRTAYGALDRVTHAVIQHFNFFIKQFP